MFMKRDSYDDRGRNQKKIDPRSHKKKRNLENKIRFSLGFPGSIMITWIMEGYGPRMASR